MVSKRQRTVKALVPLVFETDIKSLLGRIWLS